MKLEQMYHRETQQQHFGKRGMSYHGTALFVNRAARSENCDVSAMAPTKHSHPYQTYFFDDIIDNSQQQDSVAALSIIEASIVRTKKLFPYLTTISIQSDNAAAYASPFLLFMLPVICKQHGLRLTEYVHNEAGDGKTVLDGHFGVQTHMIRAYVDGGHDVTTPEQAVAALTSSPLRNTMVSLLELDLPRLKLLQSVMALSSVVGSSNIRHAVFKTSGIRVYRHSGVSQSALIPAAHVARAVSSLPPSDSPTVTGVAWTGQSAPAVISLSRRWKAIRDVVDDAAEGEPSLPMEIVRAVGDVAEYLRCTECGRLFIHVHHYVSHKCVSPCVSQTVLERGKRVAVARAAYVAPASVAAQAVAPNAALVTRFEIGWARPGGRYSVKLSDHLVEVLTGWFNDGEESVKTKVTAAVAVQRLHKMIDPLTGVLYDEDDLPDAGRVNSFFSSLTGRKRTLCVV